MAERPCTNARERPSALTRRASTISSSSSPTRSRSSANSGSSSNPAGSSNTPSTYASGAPGLTIPERGLPPSSRSSACASTVFPAPVSPVIAVSPCPAELRPLDQEQVLDAQLEQHRSGVPAAPDGAGRRSGTAQ